MQLCHDLTGDRESPDDRALDGIRVADLTVEFWGRLARRCSATSAEVIRVDDLGRVNVGGGGGAVGARNAERRAGERKLQSLAVDSASEPAGRSSATSSPRPTSLSPTGRGALAALGLDMRPGAEA
jgi:hypothetical protein